MTLSIVKIFQRLQRIWKNTGSISYIQIRIWKDITDVNNFTYTNLTWFIFKYFSLYIYIKIFSHIQLSGFTGIP